MQQTVVHATFVVKREYPASPAHVFAAWSDPAIKKSWSACHADTDHELDFRVGGREFSRARVPGGPVYRVDAIFQDIVPSQRIVYSYEMHADDARISVSLATVEFQQTPAGTQLVFTEQGAFLDGHTAPDQRRHGTEMGLDKLAEKFNSTVAT